MTLAQLFEHFRTKYSDCHELPVVGMPLAGMPHLNETGEPVTFWSVLGAWLAPGPEGYDDDEVLIQVGEEDYDRPPVEETLTFRGLMEVLAPYEVSCSDWELEMTSASDWSATDPESDEEDDEEEDVNDEDDDEDDDDDASFARMRIDFPVRGIGSFQHPQIVVLLW